MLETKPLIGKSEGPLNAPDARLGVNSSNGRASPGGPSACAVCCTFFSLVAACLLALLGTYIRSDSPHIVLHKFPGSDEDLKYRDKKAWGAFGACMMYVGTGLLSLYYWRRAV